ncbi:MAG: type II secretion system protein [Gammaproteobacteria bacterium]|uniref:type II secretion system protein n=1 Tax=Pseudacidovorax sp. TaxID=1934311 RepID=UPI001B68EC49|nr:hypothetical protein [Pseudacidovorax sp.]MBP6896835.1 hypothetical protein [Pseudacidovorax sp.]
MTRNLQSARRAFQTGVTILEVAIALAILGVLTIAAWKLQQGFLSASLAESETDMTSRADQALVSYLVRNARLPCPASNEKGLEDCSTIQGYVPWRTIGLPDAGAGALKYTLGADGLHMRPPGAIDVFELDGRTFSTIQFDGGDRVAQRCATLGRALASNLALAYEVQSPLKSDRDPAAADATSRSSIARARTAANLWQLLHCGAVVGGAARAHKDAAVAAQMMRIAAGEQLEIAELNNEAALAAFVFAVLDFVTQQLRIPSKLQDAAMNCSNVTSIDADDAAGTASPGQLSASAEAKLACATATTDVGVHLSYVAARAMGVAAAIEKLTGSNAIALQSRRDEDALMARLAQRTRDHANESLAGGLYLQPVSNP